MHWLSVSILHPPLPQFSVPTRLACVRASLPPLAAFFFLASAGRATCKRQAAGTTGRKGNTTQSARREMRVRTD